MGVIFQDEINASTANRRVTSQPKFDPNNLRRGSRVTPARTSPNNLRTQDRRDQNPTTTLVGLMNKSLDTSGPGFSQITAAQYIGRDSLGRPLYRITGRTVSGAVQQHVTAWENGRMRQPAMGQVTTGNIGSGGGAGQQADLAGHTSLQRAQSQWETWVNEMMDNQTISIQEAAGFHKIINDWTGDAQGLHQQMQLIQRNVPRGSDAVLEFVPDDAFFTPGGGGGGGGASGSFGPEYVKPDRRVVADFVKGQMVSLIGTIDEGNLDNIVNVYMADHRRDFDTTDETIDPAQSVTEAIRATGEYKRIHKLRPDSADERTWIAARRQAAAQGGLNQEQQEQFAIEQAAIGGDVDDVADAAAFNQVSNTGSTRGTLLENTVRGVANATFQNVVI